MRRFTFAGVWLLLSLMVSGGCSDALYTLGRLPGDTTDRDVVDPGPGAGGSGGGDTGASGGSFGDAGGDTVQCELRHVPVSQEFHNLFLLVDNSLSVALQPVWGPLTEAISRFVDDPAHAGFGVGIQFYGLSCNHEQYATPAVAVGPLPDVASSIKESYPLPINGAAITPALQGALTYVRSLGEAQPGRHTSLVLISHGISDLFCGSNAESAAATAQQWLSATPSVPTHVIALGAGPTLIDPIDLLDLEPLDAIAAAGGTESALRVQVDSTSSEQIEAALGTVLRASAPCAHAIPQEIDPQRAVLEWQDDAQAPVRAWQRIESAEACGEQEATWIDPSQPDRLQLCPAACALRNASPNGVLMWSEICS